MDLYAIAENLVMSYGYIGIFIISFTEAFIQPIPPDVFIIGASFFGLSPIISAVIATIGSTFGGLFGYLLGDKLGHPVFVKIFGERYLHKGEEFFNKYGIYGVVIAGFSPLPYKVIAWLSGIFEMHRLLFTIGTVIGRLPRFLAVAYFGDVLGNIDKLYQLNIKLFYLINSHYNPIFDIVMPFISKTLYPVIAITTLIILIKNRQFGIKLIYALILASVILLSLKYLVITSSLAFKNRQSIKKNIFLLIISIKALERILLTSFKTIPTTKLGTFGVVGMGKVVEN